MREIKFRLWNADTKEMIYPKLEHSQDYVLQLNCSYVGEFDKERKEYLTVKMPAMQFTGLQDKNGKDIYEGDVVKYYNYFRNAELIAEVKFMLGGYWFWRDGNIASFHNIFAGQIPTIPSQTSSDFEVIGNIYEHSHLLK